MAFSFHRLSTFSSVLADAFVEAGGADVPVVVNDPMGDVHFIEKIAYDPHFKAIRIWVDYDRSNLSAYEEELKEAV
jgi:hypothetical protein